MDKNLARVDIKKLMDKFLEIGDNRDGYVGDYTSELMTEAALSVLFAVEDVQDYLKREEMLK